MVMRRHFGNSECMSLCRPSPCEEGLVCRHVVVTSAAAFASRIDVPRVRQGNTPHDSIGRSSSVLSDAPAVRLVHCMFMLRNLRRGECMRLRCSTPCVERLISGHVVVRRSASRWLDKRIVSIYASVFEGDSPSARTPIFCIRSARIAVKSVKMLWHLRNG
mgnify:CR=1 FL=1